MSSIKETKKIDNIHGDVLAGRRRVNATISSNYPIAIKPKI